MNKRYFLYIILKKCFSIQPKMRIRNFTKMGEGLQCCRSSPREDLHWKGEDLQRCKLSPMGEGLQCCRSSGGRSAMLQILRGEGLQCCRPSGGKVCKGEGLQYNTGTSEDVFYLLAIRGPTRGEGMPGIEPGSTDPQSNPLPLRHRGGL